MPPPNADHLIHSATSTDGIHFTAEGEALRSPGGGTDPSVAQLSDGSWLMAIAYPGGAKLARSADGRSFEFTEHLLDEGIPELTSFDDGTIRLYLATPNGLEVHRSDDLGETWTLENTQPLGADPSLARNRDGSYTLYVKTFAPS